MLPTRPDRLALGTIQFGMAYGVANATGQVPMEQVRGILDAALSSGLDTLDTAAAYGESERVLGAAGLSSWKVVTKLPGAEASGQAMADWVERGLKASLDRLGASQVYGLLLHRPADLLLPDGGELAASLRVQRERGRVAKIGFSIYSPDELPSLLEVLDPDLVQAPFNVFDQRLRRSGWLARLKDRGVEVHTRSSFLQGLLLLDSEQRSTKFERWSAHFAAWDSATGGDRQAAMQMALAFCLQQPEIDRVVVGVDSLAQFHEICAAVGAEPASGLEWLATEDEHLINPSHWNSL